MLHLLMLFKIITLKHQYTLQSPNSQSNIQFLVLKILHIRNQLCMIDYVNI
jgi:hypothetical protein